MERQTDEADRVNGDDIPELSRIVVAIDHCGYWWEKLGRNWDRRGGSRGTNKSIMFLRMQRYADHPINGSVGPLQSTTTMRPTGSWQKSIRVAIWCKS